MAIALVAHTGKATAGTTPAIDTTGSSIIIIAIAWTTASIPFPAISDNKSNVWSLLDYEGRQTATGCSIALYAAINPIVGSGHTFTFTGATTSICVAAFSGTATSFPSSVNISNAVSTGTSMATGSLTPEVNNCLMLTGMANRQTGTYSVDSGFTITDQFPFSAGVQLGVALAYLIETTAAASNPTWSWTGSGIAAAAQIYVQTPVSGSSGGGSFVF